MQVTIVGAGLIGRLLGWRLTKDGHAVRLYERSARKQSESSSYVAASMLAPLSELPDCEPQIWDLAQSSLQVWPAWLEELKVPYALDGSVVVAHAQDAPLLDKFKQTLARAGAEGVCELDASGLSQVEPQLTNRFSAGLFLSGEGWLDNRRLLDALGICCGEVLYESEVQPNQVTGDVVVDCRGVNSDDPEIRGVRGEVVRIYAPEVELSRPVRLMHPKYQLYIAPRDQHEYVVGATQIESDSVAPMTVRSALELLSAAYTVHPGFAEAQILELSVGVRPAFPDHLPRVRWHEGVLQVNGLYRHGYLIGPATVNAALEEIESVCRFTSTAI